MKRFLTDNSAVFKCARTIVQAIIGIIIANLDLLISGITVIPVEYKAIVVGIVMSILSPIMATIKQADNPEE